MHLMSKSPMGNCGVRIGCGISLLAVILTLTIAASGPMSAQSTEQAGSERKIVTRSEPEYPEALKRLYIGGVVKVEAVVRPNGGVESTQLLGGSPILGQSAMKAIRQWK